MKNLDLLLMLLTFLVLGKMVIAKIPTVRNLGSPIYFIQTANEQISRVTWNFGDSATVPKNINTAISPRQVFTSGELSAVSLQVA
ncbi:hypothetical protein [Ulvibacterium sp.]|uniref:hypothetical protein n=1 Tax=Ulvibacterium sp. TaxID=2665914 RepID=UPI003BACBBCE